MAPSDSQTGEYAHAVVPSSATVTGWQVALIKLGAVVALPAFVIGAQLGTALGLKSGATSMALGGLLLTVMGTLTGAVAVRSRLSTSLITQFAFGRTGGRLVNAVLAVTLLGWFGVTAQIFAHGVEGILADLHLSRAPSQIYAVVGGLLMVATTIYGFAALRRLSDIAIPLLLIILLVATYRTLQTSSLAQLLAREGQGGGVAVGIPAVVGGLAASICVFPDLCRFARNAPHALLASGLTYGVGLPVVLILSAIISVRTGSQDVITILTTLGLGAPALILLVFKAWTTNSANLYSATLGLTTIFPTIPRKPLVAVAGSLGVVLAVFGITDVLVPFLLLLSITIPPIAGIYIADFFVVRGQNYDLGRLSERPAFSLPAFTAWMLAAAVATVTSRHVLTLTGMPAADSILTSFVLYVLLAKALIKLRVGELAASNRDASHD